MQNDRSFTEELKYQYKSGGMHIKLIFVNALFFVLITLFRVVEQLSGVLIMHLAEGIFTLQSSFSEFLMKPWGLITSIFSHFGVLHFLFNMLMLFFAGGIFRQFFSEKRLLAIYILGGICGGIFEILAHSLVPALTQQSSVVVGASGSIMAIFICMAFYKPTIPVALFGIFRVPIIYLGLFFLLIDFVNLGLNDGTAHFAHIGGALIGIIASQRPHSQGNFVYRFELFLEWIGNFFRTFKTGAAGGPRRRRKDPRKMTDEEFNLDKKSRQKQVDRILDKISKSGYESLTKAEKEFLFKQTNNN